MSRFSKLKIVALIVFVALMAAIVLPSCTFIRLNDDRVANEALITVTRNGIVINVSKNEINDYFYTLYSQNASYVQQGYYTIEQLLDYAIESKMKTAYLLTEAMPYLATAESTSNQRYAQLSGGGAFVNPVDVLTHAEKSLAIWSVNKNMDDSLESLRETAYIESLNEPAKKISKENVASIHFTAATLAYLKDVYYEGEEIDRGKLNVYVTYDDETVSSDFPVSGSMFKTAFSTEFGSDNTSKNPEEKKIEIVFEETKTVSGNVEIEEHTLSHEYTLKSTRATKNDPEEEEDLSMVEINDVKISRYATVDELKAKDVYFVERDFQAEYDALKAQPGADRFMVEAYSDLLGNMKRSYKNAAYYYNSAYQTSVLSALQAELGMDTVASLIETEIDAEILEDFDYLYATAKAEYKDVTLPGAAADNKKTFEGKITEDISKLYYYPAVEDLTGTFYVYNILFNFTTQETEFLNQHSGSEEDLKLYQEYVKASMMTKAANPDYDAEYECPLHKDGDNEATCSYEGEGVCPAVPFGKIVDSALVIDYEEKVVDVMARLEAELQAIYDDTEMTPAEISTAALAKFEEYMYMYNEDPGIMNKSVGYYGKNSNFQKPFLDLAEDVFEQSAAVGNAFAWNDKDSDGIKDSGEIGLGYTFSSYGIHLEAISFIPFGSDTDGQELTFTSDAEKMAYLKRTYDNTGKTYYDALRKAVIDAKKNTRYTDYTSQNTPEKVYERDEEDNKFTIEKDLKKELFIESKKLKEFFDEYMGK